MEIRFIFLFSSSMRKMVLFPFIYSRNCLSNINFSINYIYYFINYSKKIFFHTYNIITISYLSSIFFEKKAEAEVLYEIIDSSVRTNE